MKIISSIFVIIILVATWFYFYLRVKTQDVSHALPFSTVINKKLVLDRDVFLIRNNTPYFYKNISTIVDVEGLIGVIDKKTTIVDVIGKGTPLTITEAKLQLHGESGTYGLIIGTLHTTKHTILFKQRWGTHSVYVLDENIKTIENTDYYTFRKPIWKTDKEFNVNKTYFLPKF